MIKLLDFWAPWCIPCQAMASVIEELEKELKGKVEIEKINVDEDQAKASKYGVMSIPTFIFLKDGKEIGRKTGVVSKSDLIQLLKQ